MPKPVIFLAFANEKEDNARYLRNIPAEYNAIRQTLIAAQDKGLCEVEMLPYSTFQDIKNVFTAEKYRNRIAVFHFSGHADGFQLLLENAEGQNELAHGKGLVDYFSILKTQDVQKNLQLLFFNGCCTSQLGESLQSVIPAVIGTLNSVNDAQAKAIAVSFYDNLAKQISIKAAFDLAKAERHVGNGTLRGLYRKEVESEPTAEPWKLYYTDEKELEWKLEKVEEKEQNEIIGNNNIVIQGVTDSTITLQIDGKSEEILNKLDALMALLEQRQVQTIQTADKIYNIGSINEANFGFVMGQASYDKKLPSELKEDLLTDKNKWVLGIRQDLLNYGVSVGNRAMDIFKHYGWLVEAFLQKMQTPTGKEATLRRLSFMAEAYQSSLRYLCYIQVAQVLHHSLKEQIIIDFLQMQNNEYQTFDYLNLLIISTDLLKKSHTESFVPEIVDFVQELSNTKSDLYKTALFLEDYRRQLMQNKLSEDEKFVDLLDEYLTALAFWLRKMAFIAQYRLVSIKEINLNYRAGMKKTLFVHLYGELHGIYSEVDTEEGDFETVQLEDIFTYNQSVLLLKANTGELSFTKFLSLSPLVIDQSVFTEKPTQTPEIYYFTAYQPQERLYKFAQYKNELGIDNQPLSSNKWLTAKAQNNKQPKFNELFKQMELLFNPFKTEL